MVNTYSGGCDHIRSHSDKQPFNIHICHCSVCKRAIGQDITHLALFKHDDLIIENVRDLKIEPFNDQNLDGPLLMCSCIDCGRLIMIDDKEKRVHAIVPNLMRYDATNFPATYHAFYDPVDNSPKLIDGLPHYESFPPDFALPDPA